MDRLRTWQHRLGACARGSDDMRKRFMQSAQRVFMCVRTSKYTKNRGAYNRAYFGRADLHCNFARC
jgi:hypothetical protein